MILDGVICTTFEVLGDLGPAVAVVLVLNEENPLFLLAPGGLLDLGIQVVVPPLAALLANAPGQVFRDERPLLRPVLLDQPDHHAVLFFRPRALHQLWIQHLLPPVQALHIGAAWQHFCDLLPVAALVDLHSPLELGVLSG